MTDPDKADDGPDRRSDHSRGHRTDDGPGPRTDDGPDNRPDNRPDEKPGKSRDDRGGLPVPIPFIESLGARLLEMADGHALATVTPRAEHMNSWGVVHGGVLMAMLDFVMAMAGRSARPDLAGADGGNLTVEMKTTFIRPAKGTLTVTARSLHAGKSLGFCEGEILNAEQHLIARASGTFKFWKNS
jgi:acyl-CoA thioesterase